MEREVKIGVISDIHSNIHAFKVVVEYMKKQGIDKYIMLGDYVSDTAYPRETLDYLYKLIDEEMVWLIRGNREEYMLSQWRVRKGEEEGPLWINNSASGNLLYTYEKLDKKDFEFLDGLPIQMTFSFEDYPKITCCHGSPENSRELMELYGENTKKWLEKIDTDYMIAAHTHFPGELTWKGKHYFNSGCVGISIEDGCRAQCMILHGCEENGVKSWKPEFLSLEYDVEAAVKGIEEAGLIEKAPWFINSNIYILKTGIDRSARLVARAQELANTDNPDVSWPYIAECYFEQAAKELGIPDYRKNKKKLSQ